jgi:hypothetical protein
MPKKTEQLDADNIIEIGKIREILIDHPDLLSMFKILIIICNKRLNDSRLDEHINAMMLEDDEEYEGETDSEDDVPLTTPAEQ